MLGGTAFLSRAVAEEAVRRGHEVVCACRAASGPVPQGAGHVALDRSGAGPAEVRDAVGVGWDVVVDVARQPGWVRASVAALPDAHHVLVSTISVYSDTATRGGGPATLALHEPLRSDEGTGDPADADPAAAYGRRKVACEEAVAEAAGHWVVRPGLLVGPDDPSGRYPTWVRRLLDSAPGERVLAPGDPDDPCQVLDARDLADWLVDGAERRSTGVVDAVGPPTTRAEALAAVARAVGATPTWVWADTAFLLERGVAPWSGPGSLPLWLPPDLAGILAHDDAPARAGGLRVRPAEETAADTAVWLSTGPDVTLGGLEGSEEAALLTALASLSP